MPDEISTSVADEQAPQPEQESEPELKSEAEVTVPSSETAQPEIALESAPPSAPLSEELTPEAPAEVTEAPREAENLEAVKDAVLNPEPPVSQSSVPEASAPVSAPSIGSTDLPQATNFIRDLLQRAKAKIQNRKLKKLEKILVALDSKGRISNNEVQKLLNVSDATATRYLSLLEQQGKIKQAGKTGKYTFYTKI